VLAALAGELELLEHAGLEGLGAQLDAAEQDARAIWAAVARVARGFVCKLLRVEGDEIATFPEPFEERVHLVQHVGIARTGYAEVPFVPGHRAVAGEVRRSDIGRRVSVGAFEDPGFGMQTLGTGVVGNADLRAELGKLLQGFGLSRTGKGRRQEPESTAVLDMAPQRIAERANPALAHEGHDQIDPIRRVDLAEQLPRERRFAGGVAEEGGIEQGRERRLDLLVALAVRTLAPNRLQDLRAQARLLPPDMRILQGQSDLLRDLADQGDATFDALLGPKPLECPLRQALQLPSQPIRSLGLAQGLSVQRETRAQLRELPLEFFGDEAFVETAGKLGHGGY
jgi:hypothetical protein